MAARGGQRRWRATAAPPASPRPRASGSSDLAQPSPGDSRSEEMRRPPYVFFFCPQPVRVSPGVEPAESGRCAGRRLGTRRPGVVLGRPSAGQLGTYAMSNAIVPAGLVGNAFVAESSA